MVVASELGNHAFNIRKQQGKWRFCHEALRSFQRLLETLGLRCGTALAQARNPLSAPRELGSSRSQTMATSHAVGQHAVEAVQSGRQAHKSLELKVLFSECLFPLMRCLGCFLHAHRFCSERVVIELELEELANLHPNHSKQKRQALCKQSEMWPVEPCL